MVTREPGNDMDSAENGKTNDEEKWITHYSSNHQILLVGEGDFSFSLSLANAFASASNICASSLNSYDNLIKMYKNAMSNLENLQKLGASVLYEVDATKMTHHADLAKRKFDRIIFNFPHAGFHGKEDNEHMIQMHRKLVERFFRNARRMLRENGEIHVNHKNNYPFCLWNLEKLASGSSLALIQRVDFNKEDYPGYQNKRGHGSECDKPFPLGESSTFKFIFSPTRLGSTCKKSQQFQTIPMQLQATSSDFNYPQRNHIVNHIPLHVQLTSTIRNGNQYSRVFDRNLNCFAQTYQRNSNDVAYPVHERLRSDFDARYHVLGENGMRHGLDRQMVEVPTNLNSRVFDGNFNGLVQTYQRSSYDVAYPVRERLRSEFDARYHVLGRNGIRHGLDRQMVEVPTTLNSRFFDGNLNGLVQTYQRNGYDVANPVPERLRSDFDARYHVLEGNGMRHGHDRQMVEVPTSLNSRVFDGNLNGLVQTYQRNSYDVAHPVPERLRSDFDARYHVLEGNGMRHGLDRQMVEVPTSLNSRVFDGNLNGLVQTYQRNSYDVAHPVPETLSSGFDARYHVLGGNGMRHGLDRQMVEVPTTLNSRVFDGNLNGLVQTYQRNSYDVAHPVPETLSSDFDARYHVLEGNGMRHFPDRQMAEVPRTLNGDLVLYAGASPY